jgi:sugar phosphate isomerase/epimerase
MTEHTLIQKEIKPGLNKNFKIFFKQKAMSYNRRKFIKQTAGITSGFALASLAGNSLIESFFEENKKLKRFGLQLYTLRADMPQNPKGVLQQVASFGYKEIESYEGKDGMFWGMGNTGFKKYMDDLGMTIVSSHCDINTDFEKKANEAAAIGMKYLICPYIGPQKKLDDYKKYAEKFNACGEICRKAGLRFAYHNHDYSFKELEGELPQDTMMKATDTATVDYEMDIYWVVAAGHDPIEWFNKYPNRFTSCHVKDRAKNPGDDNGKNSTDLGTGSINFSKVLKAASKQGMQYFIVEQEFYPNGTPLQAVKVDAGYMKKLKV